ncbi:hypothetical protein ABTP12_17270, partial [Acinetobacter baumannii]
GVYFNLVIGTFSQNTESPTNPVRFINLIWLLPCAFFVLNKAISPLVGLIIAYFPLIILAIYFNAGQLEHKT